MFSLQVQVDPGALEKWIPALEEANNYLYDLLLLNVILDPLIYALRMPEVTEEHFLFVF